MDVVAPNKSFHFTIVDLKPAILAKDLLLLGVGFYFTYLAPVLPLHCFRVIQKKIGEIIDALEDRKPLPPYITVPPMYRAQIIEVLKEWQKEAPEKYPTKRVRERAHAQTQQWTNHELRPEQCEKEFAFYERTGILMISGVYSSYIEKETPKLHSAFQSYKRNGSIPQEAEILELVDKKWKPNVTMIDLQYLRGLSPFYQEVNVGHNPFQLGYQLQKTTMNLGAYNMNIEGLSDLLMFWFLTVAGALKRLRDQITIEMCRGDIVAVMEEIRYGMVGHRQQAQPSPTADRPNKELPLGSQAGNSESVIDHSPSFQLPFSAAKKPSSDLLEYPKLYDRIHLSNVPDYIGGSLTTFLYALPLLYPGKSSFLTSNCLFNPPFFKTVAHFNNEYTCLSSAEDLEKAFNTRMIPLPPARPDEMPDLLLTIYYRWYRNDSNKELFKLMPRPALETWLYRLFFKLCLPKDREIATYMIYSPLNLTVFIRLCIHLNSLGYPAHWLSGILDNILSGCLITKARPPQSNPLKIREVKSDLPALKQSTAPFVAELSTLLSMWQPIMPFGIITPDLPLHCQIRKYIVTLEPEIEFPWPDLKTFTLVFFNSCVVPPKQNIRPYLLNDETADNDMAADIRARAFHVISTWTYDETSRKARFWLREDVVRSMQPDQDSCLRHGKCADPWWFGVWRNDNWMFQAPPGSLTGKISDVGVTWAEELDKDSTG